MQDVARFVDSQTQGHLVKGLTNGLHVLSRKGVDQAVYVVVQHGIRLGIRQSSVGQVCLRSSKADGRLSVFAKVVRGHYAAEVAHPGIQFFVGKKRKRLPKDPPPDSNARGVDLLNDVRFGIEQPLHLRQAKPNKA
jgi:hypothetical protein